MHLTKTSIRNSVERIMLRHYTPACVVINKHGDIIYIHGRTGKYLEPAPGEASMNILQMARDGLRIELREIINKISKKENATGAIILSHSYY